MQKDQDTARRVIRSPPQKRLAGNHDDQEHWQPSCASFRKLCGSRLDCGADARIRAAAAEVSAHRLLDVLFGRTRRLFEQCNGGHDLPALAIATLDHVFCDPCVLNCSSNRIGSHCFDRHDRAITDVRYGDDARTCRYAADVYSAGAARTDAASELRSRQLEIFTEHPEQWC